MGYEITELGSNVWIKSNVELGMRNADLITGVFNELEYYDQDRLLDRVHAVDILFSEQLVDAVVVIVRYRAWLGSPTNAFDRELVYEAEVKVYDDNSYSVLDVVEVSEEAYRG